MSNILDRVAIAVFASSLNKPFFILGGTLMKLFFHKHQDIYNLGHYLQSTGISITLPERLVKAAIEAALCNDKPDNGICCPPEEGELFHTVGKFRYEINNRTFHMWDKYIFYATCFQQNTHFDDCNCPDEKKSFAPLTKCFRLIKSFPCKNAKRTKIIVGEYSNGESYVLIEICRDGVYLSFHIYDNFWIGKGEPFMSFGDLELTPEEMEALS